MESSDHDSINSDHSVQVCRMKSKDETSMNMNMDGMGAKGLDKKYEHMVRTSGRESGKDVVIDVKGRENVG